MRTSVSVVDAGSGELRDVLVDADPATPAHEVASALCGVEGAPPPTLYVGGRALDPRLPIASALLDGTVVGLGHPAGTARHEPDGLVEVRVVSGPGAGTVVRLAPGVTCLGGGPTDEVRVPALGVSRVGLDVDPDGTVRILPRSDRQSTILDGEAVTGGTRWPVGSVLRLGPCLLQLSPVEPRDAAVRLGEDGSTLAYNRPPRILPPEQQTLYRLPQPPTAPHRRALPVAAALVPLVLAVAMALVLDRWYIVLFGLMTPVLLVASHVHERRSGRARHRAEVRDYEIRRDEVLADATAAVVDERHSRRRAAPDPAAVLLIADGPRSRLWERRRTDPDYLLLRVGTADLPSEVVVEDPARPEHRRRSVEVVTDVPVCVPLAERGVVGVAGSGGRARQVAGWCLAQLAVLHSPSELALVVLTDAGAAEDWDWVRWLPHTAPDEALDAVRLVGTDADTCARRIAELAALVAARRQAARAGACGAPDVVVVLDGARRLRSLPGVVQLLRDGPAVGVRFLCLDDHSRLLPEECTAVVRVEQRPERVEEETLCVAQPRVDDVPGVRPDLVPRAWLRRVARAIAPLRDVGDDAQGVLPARARLLDVLGMETPDGEALADRWSRAGASTEAVVGLSSDGPFTVDLRGDGPHALVAGTTGAGKSELLQTLVASLAVANRPEAMNFVLVDYKGGAAFRDCADLPHTVGLVTDLDPLLAERALVSLRAELRRRERILADAAATDLDDYRRRSRGEAATLARLVVVIDEFASLVRELPDFVTGLVDVAQRGRSLGLHLVLATQRPSGAVSPEIRANTNLRIALRMTDPTESADVLDAPDAAGISRTTPGRAYARLAAGSVVPFQTARVGGRWPEQGSDVTVPPPWVATLPTSTLGRPVPTRPSGPVPATREAEGADHGTTDLAVLVAAARAAACHLGVAPPHRPWLDPLPAVVTLEDLRGRATSQARGNRPGAPHPAAGFAVEDRPDRQAQPVLGIDLRAFAHLCVVGAPRSGRSQSLRTIAGSLAGAYGTADLHLYGLDFGTGALLALTALPQCGAVVQGSEVDRARRLFTRLQEELVRRAQVLATGGFAGVEEQRRAVALEERLPHLVLLLDGWEGFAAGLGEADGGRWTEVLHQLLRQGAGAGVHVVLAGDRRLLTSRTATLVEDKLVLRLAERTDYALAGVAARTVPAHLPPGRALHAGTGTAVQIALLDPDPTGAVQAAALARIGAAARRCGSGGPTTRPEAGSPAPFRVDTLPARLDTTEARRLRPPDQLSPLWAMVGVGGDELRAHGPDLAVASTFLVAGPPRSGRSSLLRVMASSVLAQGGEVVVLAPRPSPLRELAAEPGVRGVLTNATPEQLQRLTEPAGPVALVVDDGELVADAPTTQWLRDYVRACPGSDRAVVLGGALGEVASGFSGWQVDVRRGRRGALLSPQAALDGDLIGVAVPRSAIGAPAHPGRALVHLGDGRLLSVQVPAP
ncbi:FtsK/SpoIIIE domain-containing protein [Aquipuribacter nitratireducens]|uniref:FtsK/SpoIIIE domain-containing protein n=1 Tax=Aquipuribacter nitratireducens TaxID=650104 RepID=A0ABW0GQL8_9MICO